MTFIGSIFLGASKAIFKLEDRFNRFRQGRAANSPDFANGFHKVSEFIKGFTVCFRGQPEPAEPKPKLNSWQQELDEAEWLVKGAREESLPEPFGESEEIVPPESKKPEPNPTDAPEFQDWGAPITQAAAPVALTHQLEDDLSETSDSDERRMEAILKNVEDALVAARANAPEPPIPVITETPQPPVSNEAPQAQVTQRSRKRRHPGAQLQKRDHERDLHKKPRQKRLKQALIQNGDPSLELAKKPLKLADERSRKVRQTPAPLVKRERFRIERAAPASEAPVETPPPTESELRKQKEANRTVDAWDSRPPKQLSKFIGRMGSPEDTCFSVLKDARKTGHAELHHTAIKLIEHFRETAAGKSWHEKARSVLSGEITALKKAKSKHLLDDLKLLASHFKTYEQSDAPDELADSDLEDLRALGKLITDLQKTANEPSTPLELKKAALLAFKTDLKRNNPHNYLQDKHEGSELARLAMQQGLQNQTDLVVKALAEVATAKEHESAVATIGNCNFSKMTEEQSAAACQLTTAFLDKAYDLKHDGAALRFHPDMIAYLNGAARLIMNRWGKENAKLNEVREFYADALVVLPLEAALKEIKTNSPTIAGMAEIVTGLAAWLFRESEKPPAGVSLEAVRDFDRFIDHHRTKARSLLHRMRPD